MQVRAPIFGGGGSVPPKKRVAHWSEVTPGSFISDFGSAHLIFLCVRGKSSFIFRVHLSITPSPLFLLKHSLFNSPPPSLIPHSRTSSWTHSLFLAQSFTHMPLCSSSLSYNCTHTHFYTHKHTHSIYSLFSSYVLSHSLSLLCFQLTPLSHSFFQHPQTHTHTHTLSLSLSLSLSLTGFTWQIIDDVLKK